MVVSDLDGAVEFLQSVFGARGDVKPDQPAELQIGDSVVMVSQHGTRDLFPAFLYVYVDDVDHTYSRALESGAHSMERPHNTWYGDRRALVRDPFGNQFHIAARMSTP